MWRSRKTIDDTRTENLENQMSMTIDLCGYDKPEVAGGPVVWLQRFPLAMRARGFDIRIRLISWHDPKDGVAFQSLQERGFDVLGKESEDRCGDVQWLLAQTSKSPADAFIGNLVVAGLYAGKHLRRQGIPTIGILHSDDTFYRGIQDEFVFGRKDLQLSSVVCVSRELEDQVRRRNPIATEVWRIPYGVPIPDTCVEPTPSRFRIAYVGRLAEEQKRISETTRALIRVCRAIPDAEAVIYGDGPDRGSVEAILATEGQNVAVRMAGNIPNSQIQEELLQFDVITLLSDYEGLPIALMEAMACGCVPVCLAMRSGIPELVQDGVTGVIIADRDASFLNAMTRLRADLEWRHKLSLNARSKIIEEYSDQLAGDQWAVRLKSIYKPGQRRKIFVPRKITLPPRNPAIESESHRMAPPSAIVRFLRRSRMLAGRLRRRLL